MFASFFIFVMGVLGLLLSVSELDILWFISSLSLVFVSSDNMYQVKTGKSVIAKLHFFKPKHQK